MKCLLVTSEVTFVGENYQQLVIPLAKHPCVKGLIIIRNREKGLAIKGLLGCLTMAAPRFGFQLFWNNLFPKTNNKVNAYKALGKSVFFTDNINSKETLDYIRKQEIDLIAHARSRSFFKDEILALPRLGCINVHHGLLPEQRGVMCDFWAHMDDRPFGFTIHQMTKKIDDGPIIKVQEVKIPKTDYMNSIFEGSKIEAEVLSQVLNQIDSEDKINGISNTKTPETRYWKNPSVKDFYRLRLRGIKV